jgi:putative serine protease PepD
MDATEGTKETGGRGRRRLLLIPATFAVGAVAAAGVITGFGVADSSGPASTASNAAVAATSSIAKTTTSLDAATIYKQDSPGVVDIRVTESASQGQVSPFSPGGSQQATAEGTGYVYDKSGHVITADHVVSGASKITVRFQDGSTATATLVGSDPSSDTAVIKVSVPASKLTPLTLGNSSTVEPGEGVVAIGSPFGYTESITAGIVSAVDRTIQAPNGYSISNTIQTDAPINHGNSGGPLIDGSGKVVGTNVQIAVDDQSSSSVNAGVGFAVPSNTVKTVVDSLIAGKAVEHAYLGVSVGDSQSGTGAQVGTVRSGSPAATAGLKQGDVVTAIDGQAVADANALTAAVGSHQPGDTIHVTVKRNGSTVQLTVKLGTRPASTTA